MRKKWNIIMMNYNIVQINLNHCWGAHDMLQNYMKEKDIDVAMVKEPVWIPEGNWIGSGNKSAAIHWTNKVRDRIKVRGGGMCRNRNKGHDSGVVLYISENKQKGIHKNIESDRTQSKNPR